jgi:ADP-dependent NAD(P)H-hydrate dehydratase
MFSPSSPPLSPPVDLPRLAVRRRDSSKRDYGRVLVVGGAAGMAGAPALAAMAALRSGAGLVDLAAPEGVATIAAGFDPCVMTHPLPARDGGTFAHDALEPIAALASRADALAVGPGLGRSEATEGIVRRLWEEFPGPAVFDADALWWLARLDPQALATHAGPRVLTPHAGEMRRFLAAGSAAGAPPSAGVLEAAATSLAAECGLVILLKGPDTLITDGSRQARNATGNPGMASGGSGDVLTGILAALFCQPQAGPGAPHRFDPFDAARVAAWVHGRAGDLAAAELGELSLTARDLITWLPRAFPAIVAPAG